MKLLLSLLTAGAVSAGGHKQDCNPLPALAQACKQDYSTYCRQVDDEDFVSLLACGKSHEESLQPQCLAEIQKSFPALYACSNDIHAACPSFGRLAKGQWEDNWNDDDDDDDDDDDSRRQRWPRQPDLPLPTDWNMPPPPREIREESSEEAGVLGTVEVDETEPFHGKKKPVDSEECLKTSLPLFSTPCHSAIAEQWIAQQQKKGVNMPNPPTADEIYDMLLPPAPSSKSMIMSYKMQHLTTAIVVAVFMCLLLTCLCCCCCRRMKKQRARRVAALANEVPLSPLPAAVAVPVSGSTGFVPMATPVSVPAASPVVPQINRAPAYLPYTAQGLSGFMPVAQPVHV